MVGEGVVVGSFVSIRNLSGERGLMDLETHQGYISSSSINKKKR